ncbi:hypothetical protein DCO17_10255 [Polynucleobacter tropicus]|uniref:Uncharacterized protein n=1 Tax=Polynucleobacter tropicus TaxID=1743174 RepID=A0A6M9Q5I6_9BURK|nr:hypothetical protein [Polynucleobacter tropicus]QKM65586.1 hypothetical protein DCO17_10255 [Polynucleobacter tropicus]
MYKATRELIKARQPFTNYVVEVVKVKQVGGLKPNNCLNNAHSLLSRKNGIKIVSGWFIEPYDPLNYIHKGVEIIQHWWNVDASGQHFDTTLSNHIGEYVVDMEIAEYAREHYDDIESTVASSLLFTNNEFMKVNLDDDEIFLSDIPSLDTENLYLPCNEAANSNKHSITLLDYCLTRYQNQNIIKEAA